VRFPGWWAILPVAGTALIISAGTQAWVNRALLSNKALVWIGLISYPLYLWHWPLLTFARIVEGDTPSAAMRVAAVCAAILLAWLTYQLLEKPLRFGPQGGAKTIALVTTMIAIGYLGYNCDVRDGLGFRFPKIVQDLTEFNYDHKSGYREGTCFLTEAQDYSAFAACETPTGIAGTNSILIWGDSHAAHLYPGYKSVLGADHAIIQRTASACPPLLNTEIEDRPHCKGINDHVFELIKTVKPHKIVLAANWSRYDWRKIGGTVEKLRDAGIADIDLVGPGPQWEHSLPFQLYLRLKSAPSQPVPKRMASGLRDNFMQLDMLMSAYAAQLKVNYISPAQIFCNKDGCMTRLGETGDTITFWDCCHLTGAGSHFLISNISQK
jgi:SGNH domain (fused to AT3 domains)